jgi:hypothetical protein
MLKVGTVPSASPDGRRDSPALTPLCAVSSAYFCQTSAIAKVLQARGARLSSEPSAIGQLGKALRLEFLDLEGAGRATHLYLNGRRINSSQAQDGPSYAGGRHPSPHSGMRPVRRRAPFHPASAIPRSGR